MAKLKRGILGPITGKLGPIIGSSWMGIPYIKQAPRTKAEPIPPTTAQIANRQKMKFVNQLLVPFQPYVTIGFANLAIRKTALSVAYSVNYHAAITGTYPNLGTDFSKMIISQGDLPNLNTATVRLTAASQIEITWLQNEDSRASFDDQLMLVLYCPDLNLADGFTGGVKRMALQHHFSFNPQFIGHALEVYLSVSSLNRKKIADSIYMGRMEPL
ncbi:hypothetical protein HDC92_001391 [Pedobacter sp. AK017]|uniref:DUF6266 family protein n=1 Tax=Pedobacter sp. AK017 TaxID=2723073 RepID=UPI00161B1188|nr:DUF6266 family protein [Pedobacter sp. AK017]MBB5437717.1 hypothetical protein [Pedobacter sp. AK017]